MRTLEFIVNGQHIQKDPKCDFSHIVAGSKNYLRAHFTFSDDWKDCVKAASFWRGGEEHGVILDNNDSCMIPPEALVGMTFAVTVLGRKGKLEIPTDRVTVRQEVFR